MSVEMVVKAMSTEVGDASAHLLLIWLADYYNDETGYAWPSIDTLANKMHVSRRTVQNKLRYLEQRNYITIETRPDDTSKYVVLGGANPAWGAKSAPKLLTDNNNIYSNNIGRKICTPRQMLEKFEVDTDLRSYAADRDINDADALAQRMRDYYLSMNRIPDRNWRLTFMTWCRNEQSRAKTVKANGSLPPLTALTEKQQGLMQIIIKKAKQQFGAEYYDYHKLYDAMHAAALNRENIKKVAEGMGVNVDG